MWILLTLLYGIVALAPSYSLDELDCSQARTSRVAVEAGAASEILDQANAGKLANFPNETGDFLIVHVCL